MSIFSDVLLTVDFDRTLTAPDSSIPARNLEAIRYFIENGGTFTVNTGRSLPMSHIYKDIVPVNAPLLVYNGSAWYDTKTDTLCNCALIPLDPVEVIADVQDRFPELNVEIQGLEHHYLYQKNEAWERYCAHNGCPWAYEAADKTGPFLKFAVYGKFESAYVGSMFNITPREAELFEQVMAHIQEHYGDVVDMFRACPRILDVHAKGVSKINSARKLQQELGKKILVCVGDAENDLNMLYGADYAFCPGDASIASLFPNVCPCGEGAVADVIYEKIPAIVENRS